MASLDIDHSWVLHPQVSVRPEPFGALVYHFGTRKLSFLKDRRLLAVVNLLSNVSTVRMALTGAGVGGADIPRYQRALETLADSSILVERPILVETPILVERPDVVERPEFDSPAPLGQVERSS